MGSEIMPLAAVTIVDFPFLQMKLKKNKTIVKDYLYCN